MKSIALFLLLAATGLEATAADAARVYAFQAFLDDKPIGEHRFTISGDAASRRVTSEADFTVKILGITAYRYHHRAEEQWAGDCLSALQSDTDDDGKSTRVRLVKAGDVNEIAAGNATSSEPGCLMTFAYWNAAMRERRRLLNPQTGKVAPVTVERVGTGTVKVDGRDVAAVDWRVSGGESPIDVWISEQGEWVGLDSLVAKGKHKLSYRRP